MPVFNQSGKDFRTSGPWLANSAIAALYYTITVGAKLASLQNAQAGNLDVKREHQLQDSHLRANQFYSAVRLPLPRK
jgi:hypothetical protein